MKIISTLYTVSIMAAAYLLLQRARASVAIQLTLFAWNILVTVPEIRKVKYSPMFPGQLLESIIW